MCPPGAYNLLTSEGGKLRTITSLLVVLWAVVGCGPAPASVPTPTAFRPEMTQPLTDGPLATLESELAGRSFVMPENELEPIAAEVLVRVNQARLEVGLEPLHASTPLSLVAALRAKDMVARDYFDHVDPRRGTVEADRLVRPMGVVGEIAELLFTSTDSQQDLPRAALDAWRTDEANRSTLMDGALSYAGAGVMGDGTWWVVVLVLTEAAP